MPDLVIRALSLGGLAALAVLVGMRANHARRSSQPLARLERLDLDAAVVAFTSTDCSNCKKVMRMLGGLGVTVREVTFELEPGLFEAAGVEGVPLVVVARRDGNAAVQFGGSVRRAAVARALRRAGS